MTIDSSSFVNMKFAVLDDNRIIHRTMEDILGKIHWSLFSTNELRTALADESFQPDCVFVDVNLRESESGLDVIPHLTASRPSTAVIVITANPELAEVSTLVTAFLVGANDYILKPLKMDEVRIRTRARVEESKKRRETNFLRFGDIGLDRVTRRVEGSLGSAKLSPQETEILSLLISDNGATSHLEKVRSRVWEDEAVTVKGIRTTFQRLSKALSGVSRRVKVINERGVGYRLSFE